ncbi:MAG: hypothetical protein EOM91_21480 [Sphingobacteriia bacterium]|nr:hypothetical protein [Sphingobacteriia bacterium]NCC39968.1 hypothetical protein [Gammaproteobacteria bacterium]
MIYTPLLIRPGFSRRLAGFVLLTHLLAAAVSLAWLEWWSWPLLAAITLSGLHAYHVHVLRRAPWSIRAVFRDVDGTWRVALVSGAEHPARIDPATFVSLPLVVLRLRLGRWRVCALPLFADALDPEQLRRLRQCLRIEHDITNDAKPEPTQ